MTEADTPAGEAEAAAPLVPERCPVARTGEAEVVRPAPLVRPERWPVAHPAVWERPDGPAPVRTCAAVLVAGLVAATALSTTPAPGTWYRWNASLARARAILSDRPPTTCTR